MGINDSSQPDHHCITSPGVIQVGMAWQLQLLQLLLLLLRTQIPCPPVSAHAMYFTALTKHTKQHNKDSNTLAAHRENVATTTTSVCAPKTMRNAAA